jgi:hypothetical protein
MPMANSVINEKTGASLECQHLIKDDSTFTFWNKAAANEFGRLAQGVGDRIEGSNTILFIPRQAVPKGKIVTYCRFVVDIRPNKSEIHQVRLTVGGNLIQYPGDVSTRSADLTTSKVHNGYLYVDVRKGMYGLPQAGVLANVLLEKRLAKHGNSPVPHTHGLWTIKWRPIKFSLVVDDFESCMSVENTPSTLRRH